MVLPGYGHLHFSKRVRKTPIMRVRLLPSLGLTNFSVLVAGSVERWRATRGSFTFGISGRWPCLLVHALRVSVHNYEPKFTSTF